MADPALKTSKLAYQILGDVKKVSPKAGDVIVVEHKLPLATGDRMKVQKQFQSLFPNNTVVVMYINSTFYNVTLKYIIEYFSNCSSS